MCGNAEKFNVNGQKGKQVLYTRREGKSIKPLDRIALILETKNKP
jgi:hypothetical protein